MKRNLLFAGLALALTPLAPAQEQEGARWIADFDQAVEIARSENKDLLVDFTGSDWCGWCIKLHDEVFRHESFWKPASEAYVLVALDFPNGPEAKAKVPNPERNEELARQYGIQGFPTVLLMTPDGEVFGTTGYRPGGPEAYVQHLEELATAGRKGLKAARELAERYEQAEDKVAVVREALTVLAGMSEGTAGRGTVAAIARKAYELDPANEAGLYAEATEALVQAGILEKDVMEAAWKVDPKNEKGLIEKVIVAQCRSVDSKEACEEAIAAIRKLDEMGGPKDEDVKRELYVNAAYWCGMIFEDLDGARVFAQKAKDLGGLDERTLQMLDQILNG